VNPFQTIVSAAATQASGHQYEDFATVRWYVDHILPWAPQGGGEDIVIAWAKADGTWRHAGIRTGQDAEQLIRKVAADRTIRGIYAAQGRMAGSRKSENAVAFKSIWLDVDAKNSTGAADSQELATQTVVAEFNKFSSATGLPDPSAIISTGGGAHFFWLFTHQLGKERWNKLARGLRNCVEQYGLPADVGCTTDAARVLRIAGTLNRKPGYGMPRLTRILRPQIGTSPKQYTLEELEAKLASYAGDSVASQRNVFQFPPRPPLSGIGEQAKGAREIDPDRVRSAALAIPSAVLAVEEEWMRVARALAHTAWVHPDLADVLWDILDTVSRAAPGYDEVQNRRRWDRYINEASAEENPITIATLFHLAGKHGWSGWPIQACRPAQTRNPLKGGTYDPEEALELLNSWFFVADVKGAAPIAQIEDDSSITYIAPRDFRIKLANIFVRKGDGHGGVHKVNAEKFWLQHERRHARKIGFNPKAPPGAEIPGEYNLWRGFAVEPQKGWQKQLRLLQHVWVVLCRRDKVKFKYLMRWLAWAVQNPDKAPETVIVLKSRFEGTGKSTLSYVMRDIFGKHARVLANKERLFGRFSADLETACFICAEEMLWAGDRTAADALKSLITGDTLTLEIKNGPRWDVPNRLHMLMTTNHDHAIHAGARNRRVLVLDASPEHAQEAQWFDPLYEDLENGGREEFLWLLLNLKLKGWHPRTLPKTAETVEQQRFSADTVSQWAQACIDADAIIGGGKFSLRLNRLVPTHVLYEAYKEHCKHHPVNDGRFGKALTEMFGEPTRKKINCEEFGVLGKQNDPRPRSYHVPDADTWQGALDARLGVSRKK
jgi:hypothetical protein